MDGTRERPPQRAALDRAGLGGLRTGAPSGRRPAATGQSAVTAGTPVSAPDILIDTVAPEPPPIPLVTPALTAPSSARFALPLDAARRVCSEARRLLLRPLPLGAAAASAAILLAAILLRPDGIETELAPVTAAEAAATTAPVMDPARAALTIHLRIGADLAPEARKRIETALLKAGYGAVVLHQMPFSISRSRVGYFREADRDAAEGLIATLRGTVEGIELRDYRTLIETPEPGRLDLWIGS
jgi:hypothetical protein